MLFDLSCSPHCKLTKKREMGNNDVVEYGKKTIEYISMGLAYPTRATKNSYRRKISAESYFFQSLSHK